MRAVIVTRRAPPAVGGMERHLQVVGQALDRTPGVDLDVLAWRSDEGEWSRLHEAGLATPPRFTTSRDEGLRIAQLRLTRRQRLALAPLVLHHLPLTGRFAYGRSRLGAAAIHSRVVGGAIVSAAERADIVHAWGPDLLAAAAGHASRRLGARFVVTPFTHPGQWGDDPVTVRVVQQADAVGALSEADAATYVAMGAPRERVHVCGAAAAPPPAPAPPAEVGHRPTILFLGAKRAYKGADIVAAAAPIIAASNPAARVILAGPGPLIEAPHVLDLGQVSEERRLQLLRDADVVLLPSLHETFGLAVIEAWSVGTPVVVSDAPALRELVEAAAGGLVVRRDSTAVADGCLRLLAYPHLAREMGASGRRYFEAHHAAPAVAAAHLEVYRRVLQAGPLT